MNKIETILREFFDSYPEAKTSQIIEHTKIARSTVQKYLAILVKQGELEALGEGRGRYYHRVYSPDERLTHLAVIKNDILVGKLSYGNGSHLFEYDKNYSGDELIGISKNRDNQSALLYPIFENLLPEYERRAKILRAKKENADILISLDNVQGDFRFIPYYQLYKYQSKASSKPSWSAIKHKILGENKYPNLLNMEIMIDDKILQEESQREHSSLSGYQHKIDINIDFDRGFISESIHNAKYLMKPLNRTMIDYFAKDKNRQKRYYPLLALNEHLFMSFAKNELHLNTPMSGIVWAKGGDFHYIVKRYDRYQNYTYGQYDMAQLLNIPSEKKYNTDSITILQRFKEKVKDEKSRMDMLKFQVFSSLIQHSDFHAKNMGIIDIGKEKYILAPLYDVISVGLYKGDAHDMGLPLSETRRKWSKYNLEDYLNIAKTIGIGKIKAKIIIKQTIEIFLDKFPIYIQKTIAFENEHNIEIRDTRIGYKRFSAPMQSMYNRKIIQLKRQGILQELGLVKKYGVVLKRQRMGYPSPTNTNGLI